MKVDKARTPVIWLHGLECTCCSEFFIRSAHPLARPRHGGQLPAAHGAGLFAAETVSGNPRTGRWHAEEARRAGHRPVLDARPHRRALGHWIRIKGTKIDNCQCVVPTTWNGGPRDHKGQIGAFEASLMDTPAAKADEPLEILRTLHSFGPCLACSTHVMSTDGQEVTSVKVR